MKGKEWKIMSKECFVVKEDGYPIVSLNSRSDAEEMILAIAEDNAYFNFYTMTQSHYIPVQSFMNYVCFCRDTEFTPIKSWYGFLLFKNADDYRIGKIVHLD